MSDQAKLWELEIAIRQKVPGFEIEFRDQSKFQKFLLAIFPPYRKTFASTFGKTVWFGSETEYQADPWLSFKVLAHEFVHLLEPRFWFHLTYVLPQLLAAFSLLALLAIWFSKLWLISLVALLFVVCPSYPRAHWEMRAYTMGTAINHWKHIHLRDSTVKWIVGAFTSPMYLFMWPFKKSAEKWIRSYYKEVQFDRHKKISDAFEIVREIVLR